jgi:Alkylmercury lyase
MPRRKQDPDLPALEKRLRILIYRHFIQKGRAPKLAEMAKMLSRPLLDVRAVVERLGQSHAIVPQEDGELWRAAPFSAIPTAFPVEVGKRSWYGNCIWDALGILAMLHKSGRVLASCGCCNSAMPLRVKNGDLAPAEGIIHIAVPASHWYDDIVFT